MSDLTLLKVNLVPKAVSALDHAAEMTGDTRTDTVNRALQIYAHLIDASNLPGNEHRVRWEPTPGLGEATIVLLPPARSER